MKLNIILMIILAVFLTGCESTDHCLRREVFNNCLDKADVVNSQVISRCKDASFYLSQRNVKNIREGCK